MWFDNYLKAIEVNSIKLLLNPKMKRKCPAEHLLFHVQDQVHIPTVRYILISL